MKKNGFTLAETLITLAVIGLVAAITIPSLYANLQKQANISKLGASINALENAFGMMVTKEDVVDISKTAFGESPSADNLKTYLSGISKSGGTYTMKNGATFTLSKVSEGGILNIDINGTSSPNKDGEDQFTYKLNDDGYLTPDGKAVDLAANNYKYKAK